MALHHADPRGVGRARRRRTSRTTRRGPGAPRRPRTSSSATAARGGGYEPLARPGRARARAALGRGGATSRRGAADGAPHARGARERAALLERAQHVAREGCERVPVAHDRRRGGRASGAEPCDHRRRGAAPRSPGGAACGDAHHARGDRRRRANGSRRTPTAWRSRTCRCASGGSATCPTTTTCSTAWSSTPTSSSSTRPRWICATSRSCRASLGRSRGQLRAGRPHLDPPAAHAGPHRAVLRRRAGAACLAVDRTHHHRVRRRGRASRTSRARRPGLLLGWIAHALKLAVRSPELEARPGMGRGGARASRRSLRAAPSEPTCRPGASCGSRSSATAPASRSSARKTRRSSGGRAKRPAPRSHPRPCASGFRTRRPCSSAASSNRSATRSSRRACTRRAASCAPSRPASPHAPAAERLSRPGAPRREPLGESGRDSEGEAFLWFAVGTQRGNPARSRRLRRVGRSSFALHGRARHENRRPFVSATCTRPRRNRGT